MSPKIILTCEHGGSEVSSSLRKRLLVNTEELNSHHSLDFGAAKVCSKLKSNKHVTAHINLLSRLLIDMNRRPEDFKKKSKYLLKRGLTKDDLIIPLKKYNAYRKETEDSIKSAISLKQPFYIFSVHSFVPIFKGQKRATDIGILFRTDKNKEANLAKRLKGHFKADQSLNGLNIYYNRPYRGHTDCFLNDLLDNYGKSSYCLGGCFLEFNGALLKAQSTKIIKSMSLFLKVLSLHK